MARIGIFALNMSPRSGGVFSLIDGLMTHAGQSRHRFVYLAESRPASAPALPDNVELLTRPGLMRMLVQGGLRMPGIGTLFAGRATAIAALSAMCGVSPRLFTQMDAWLWPHAFVPVPSLGRMMVICHDLIHRHHPEYFGRSTVARRARAERTMQRCAAVLCPSRATADDLVATYPSLATRVRPFAEAPCDVVPVDQCRREMEELETQYGDTPLLLFVAVDWPHKNHRLLIEAAGALKAQLGSRAFRIVFVGHRRDGDALASAIRAASAGDVVVDAGGVSRPLLAAYYRRATALVYPSLCEGFGIPLVEAMQYDLPILASDRSSIPEVCGDAAVLLDPTAPDAWADQMGRVIDDPQWRAALSDRSRARGRAFNWQRTWQDLDAAIAAVVESPAHATSDVPAGREPAPIA